MKSKHVLQAAAVLVLLTAGGLAPAAAPQRYAVIIGINDYADPAIPDLKYAESDAKAVYDTLTDPSVGRFDKANVTLILGKRATPSEIKAALYRLRGADKDDLIIIFFSGHGAKEAGRAFWVTQNAKANALPVTSVSNSDIRDRLKEIPSQRMVILLDCCYAASTVKKSFADPAGLFGDFTGKGRVTIAGAAENQEALEYQSAKAGVFSHYLVRGLRGAADVNTDGVVTFEEIWEYLGTHVRKASVKQGGLHEPKLLSEDGLTPQFLLTFNPTVAAASEAAVKTLRKLFAEDKISGAQFDLGRKVLGQPALDALAKARREVFTDLVTGGVDPKYLATLLKNAEQKAGTPKAPQPSGKPTVAVVPFLEYGKAKGTDAGSTLAVNLLPLLGGPFTLIDRMQLAAFLREDKLTMADLVELAKRRRTKTVGKAVRLRGVRYLVVGSVSGLPDGSLSVTAHLSDWQTGRIRGDRVAQIAADDWRTLLRRLPELAGRLTGRPVSVPHTQPSEKGEFERVKELLEQLAAQRKELARARKTFTDKHPRLLYLRSNSAALAKEALPRARSLLARIEARDKQLAHMYKPADPKRAKLAEQVKYLRTALVATGQPAPKAGPTPELKWWLAKLVEHNATRTKPTWLMAVYWQATAGDYAGARESIRRIAKPYERLWPLASVAAQQARTGDLVGARRSAAQAQAEAARVESRLQPYAQVEVAASLAAAGDLTGARAIADRLGERRDQAYSRIISSLCSAGKPAEGRRLISHVKTTLYRLIALSGFVGTYMELGDSAAATAVLRQAMDLYRNASAEDKASVGVVLARVLVSAGDKTAALRLLDESEAALRGKDNKYGGRNYGYKSVASNRAFAGDFAGAKALAGRMSGKSGVYCRASTYAEVALQQGLAGDEAGARQALALARAAAAGGFPDDTNSSNRYNFTSTLVSAMIAAGQVDEVKQWLTRETSADMRYHICCGGVMGIQSKAWYRRMKR